MQGNKAQLPSITTITIKLAQQLQMEQHQHEKILTVQQQH